MPPTPVPPDAAALDVAVLGRLEVRRDGSALDLGTPKQRTLVAALVLARGWPVSVDGIIDHLWGDNAPGGVTGTLQAYVSQLRKVLEPDRAPRTPASVLVTAAPGYALRVPEERVDAHCFEQVVGSVHQRLQPLGGWGRSTLSVSDLERAQADLVEALGWWRGTPYADLGDADADAATAERTRLEGLRLVALEDHAVVALALGHHATVAAELEALVGLHPLRERMWALRAVALARSGRQADALEVLRQVREVLADELGIEPSSQLRDLQTAVLRQDPELDWVAPEAVAIRSAVNRVVVSERTPAPDPATGPHQVAPWPMMGRDAELAAIGGLLDDAVEAVPAFVVLTGEPGIGKSRLAAEALLQARRRGVRVLVGRCSQDEGAPPLWPWGSVLAGIGVDLVALSSEYGADEGAAFRAWERIAGGVREATREQPVALLLEDLHWADAPSLRVLRLLVESVTDERLLVVATWRDQPPATDALADVAESLARRHALRLDLVGLAEAEVGRVFEAVAGRTAVGDQADVLVRRTDGNPFFVVELARLAADRGGGVDLAGGRLPTAVEEVLDRRLARLPDATVGALRVAAVIGRRFDLGTLAEAAGVDADEALDVVEPAQAAGLLREQGIDHYLFTHALVRDRLRDSIGASRRARTHARVAEVLAQTPGHASEVARHWQQAGPAHAARAWRAAVAAAALARALHDHDEAGRLLADALRSMADDPAATERDRYAVMMDLIDAHKWAVRVQDLVDVVEDAIDMARRLGDPAAVAQAAVAPSVGVLWRADRAGQLNQKVLGALTDSLDRLPEGDGELRCRVLGALALELSSGGNERFDEAEGSSSYGEAARAMASRLGDPGLLMSSYQLSFTSTWQPSTADARLLWATESLRIAEQIGDERAAVVSGTLRAMVLGELGRVAEMADQAASTRIASDRLRIPFGDLMLSGLEAVWAAVAGRTDHCQQAMDRIEHLGERLDHESTGEALGAARLVAAYWEERTADALDVLDAFVDQGWPFSAAAAVYRWRAGDEDGARLLHARGISTPCQEDQLSVLQWCFSAELALYLGDPALAAEAEPRLRRYADRPCTVGGAIVMAPVAAYLALAAAAQGRTADATADAETALDLARAWGSAAVVPWLAELRERYGF